MTNHETPASLTELEIRSELFDAMDGNLRMSRRRNLIDAYRDAIEARGRAEADAATDLLARAELCAEGDCPHAHQARKAERETSGYRHELETVWDYLEDRGEVTAEGLATLRGILARALDR